MNRRVLLIDSDSAFRETLTQQLARYRVVVMTEPEPERAFALAAAEPPDLLVIAVEEPEKLGFKTFQKARKALAAKLPIMLVTQTLPPESFTKHRGMKVHADEYLDKRDLDNAVLVAKVDGLIALGEPDADDDGLPIGEDIPMEELGDSDVVLDEQLEDDDVGSFANDQKNDMATINPHSEVLVDSMVAQETDAAFDALLGDDMFGGGGDPVAPEPAATEVAPMEAESDAAPEPVEDAPVEVPHDEIEAAPVEAVEAVEAVEEDSAIPEPVPHKISEPGDVDSVPAPIRDGGRETGDDLNRYSEVQAQAQAVDGQPSSYDDDFEDEAGPVSSIPIVDDDLVSLDDETPVEVQDDDEVAAEAVPEPEPEPEPAVPEPIAAAPQPEPVPEAIPQPRAKNPTGSQPNRAVDLGLDSIAQNVEAEREQSGVYDHKGLRKIGELERQITQLKTELERSRATADAAAKGNRESQFLNLREQNLAREKELKDAKKAMEQHAKELGDITERLKQAQHAKEKLEAQNAKLEQQIFDGKERELQETLDALAAKLSGVESQLEATSKAAQTAEAALAQTREELATERENRAASASDAEQRLRAEREQLVQRHESEVAALKAEAEAARARLEADAESAQESALVRLREELDAAHGAKLDETIEELRRANAQEHQEAVDALEKSQSSALVNLKAEQAGELARVQSELSGKISELEAQLASASQAHVVAIAGAEQHGARAAAEVEARYQSQLDQAAAAAADREAALNAQLDQAAAAAAEREAALKAQLDQAAAAAAEREAAVKAELEQTRAKYEAEIEARDEEANEARERDAESHGQAIAQLKAQLDRTTAAHEVKLAAAQRETQELAKQHETALAELGTKHDAALAELRTKHEADIGQLGDGAKRTAETHRAALAEQQQRYEAQLAELSESAQREVAEQRAQLHAAKKAAEDAAAQHQAAHESLQQAHASAMGELEGKHERAIAVINGEALKAKSIADAEHGKEVAALKAETERKLRELEETHARTVSDMTAERDELKKGLSGARDSLKRSESELASAVQTIADRNADLRAHAAAIAERDQRITELRGEIESLEGENASYQEQVLRAYQKIKSDEVMVARARKAMAIALTVLDDQGNPPTTKPET